MILLECPDCGGTDFIEDFQCRRCFALRALGKPPSLSPRILLLARKSLSAANHKNPSVSFRIKVFISFGVFFLSVLAGITFSLIQTATAKPIESIRQQFVAQNEFNRFSIETDEDHNLHLITLTQENVELIDDTKNPLVVKFLFDCAIQGKGLEKTVEEYQLTILSEKAEEKNIQFGELIFKTDSMEFPTKKDDRSEWKTDGKYLEYVSFKLSRSNLVEIAESSETEFRLGEFRGRISFAQQQAIESLLLATSTE